MGKIFIEKFELFVGNTLCTLVGTAVDTLVLWICSHFIFSGYAAEYLLSPLISFECANLTNYLVTTRSVWRGRMEGADTKLRLKRFLEYNISCSGVFLLKMLILLLVERMFSLDVVWCNLMALSLSGIVNFIIQDLIIFKKYHGNETKTPIDTNSDIDSERCGKEGPCGDGGQDAPLGQL